ncbi:putative Myb-like transcription factor-like protein [Bisporella sp. PMI_857]|nr:putative Myb-like transcription factor-like protein [Bisporella sp. PMI_857]
MSKRADRTELKPAAGVSPSHPHATAIDPFVPQDTLSPANTRNKRRASGSGGAETFAMSGPSNIVPASLAGEEANTSASSSMGPPAKKSRTNTPWTPAEEQRLKTMRDAGNSWAEIAKTFPARTEGSVKKHWYKDMHYAEFAEDESQALLNAIKEYEANKWKTIGAKVGKPAKACEQYAKENFAGRI